MVKHKILAAAETENLKTFDQTVEELDKTMARLFGGEMASRQIYCTVVVLLKRIESLEARLDANGIYS
jgi:hypothetical protein